MQEGVFRMQRGELDRNSGRRGKIACRLTGQPVDRALVTGAIAFRIGIGHRRFAEHVEAVGQALGAFGCRTLERFIDRAAVNELAAEDLHRLQRRLADDRFTQPRNRPLERAAHAFLCFFGPFQHFAGQHQREGRCIDECRRAFAEMFRPVDIADLVADQRIRRRRIGYAQERFGKAHQRHTLFGRQPVLVQERVDPARLLAPGALDQPCS